MIPRRLRFDLRRFRRSLRKRGGKTAARCTEGKSAVQVREMQFDVLFGK